MKTHKLKQTRASHRRIIFHFFGKWVFVLVSSCMSGAGFRQRRTYPQSKGKEKQRKIKNVLKVCIALAVYISMNKDFTFNCCYL